MSSTYRVCTKCVMDTTDRDLTFDTAGVCSICTNTAPLYNTLPHTPEEEEKRLGEAVDRIKEAGEGRKYDCLMGLSGGVDSSYVALLAGKMGLRPLVVHFDNGWNSELAVENINKIVNTLGFDLETYVINWNEFRDMQRSFFKASVIDIELLTDHAITASLFRLAKKYGIKHLLAGGNIATESGMPRSWSSRKSDSINIRAIHREFGEGRIKSFPIMSTTEIVLNRIMKGREVVKILNEVIYKKLDAIKALEQQLGWKYYGGKHYESVFTKFYQAYYLPEKFNVDKRKTHLSSLVRNGEISREEAVEELAQPLYDSFKLQQEKEYVLKKLGFSEGEFDQIMALPIKDHNDYASEENYTNRFKFIRSTYDKIR